MAQLVVRNLDDDVKARLRTRAREHGRSMEEEVRSILRAALIVTDGDASVGGLGTCIARRFAGLGLDEDIEELRGSPVRPASFTEAG